MEQYKYSDNDVYIPFDKIQEIYLNSNDIYPDAEINKLCLKYGNHIVDRFIWWLENNKYYFVAVYKNLILTIEEVYDEFFTSYDEYPSFKPDKICLEYGVCTVEEFIWWLTKHDYVFIKRNEK